MRKMFHTAVRYCLIALVCLTANVAFANDTMVIVVAGDSELPTLSRLELRKIYLGIPMKLEGERLNPIVNESKAALTERFHQHIIGMTKTSYNRKLMRNRLNYASDPPQSRKNQTKLFNIVSQDKYALSYAWLADVKNSDANLKVLQVIWRQD